MRRYAQVTAAIFSLLAAAQFTRAALRWTVSVHAVTVPVWASVVACIALVGLAIWGFRTAKTAA